MFTTVALLLTATMVDVRPPDSICYGTPSHGRLEHGLRIVESGPNFDAYSSVGVLLGRTYVHSKVAEVIRVSYELLESTAPGKTYLYGESGWRSGGQFRPHKTHQNGLAVDFMVPVIDASGKSVPLPTGVLNDFGYAVEFDARAMHEDLTIDFEAIVAHLHALSKAAKSLRVGISRVIFEREYLPKLYAAPGGSYVRDNIPFMEGTPWVRHDEHYHVDFTLPCRSIES